MNGWRPAPVVFQEAAKDKDISFQKSAYEKAPVTASAPTPALTPKGARTGNLKPAQSQKDAPKETGRGHEGRGSGRGAGLGV